jgi:hypothetical protein
VQAACTAALPIGPIEEPMDRRTLAPPTLVTVVLARHHCRAHVAEDYDSVSDEEHDRGQEFDGVTIGRPATGALIDAGYRRLTDLPDDLDELLQLHGVGPSAVRRLQVVRDER